MDFEMSYPVTCASDKAKFSFPKFLLLLVGSVLEKVVGAR